MFLLGSEMNKNICFIGYNGIFFRLLGKLYSKKYLKIDKLVFLVSIVFKMWRGHTVKMQSVEKTVQKIITLCQINLTVCTKKMRPVEWHLKAFLTDCNISNK